jgi:hypothetical protein
MRRVDDRYICALCGEVIPDVALDGHTRTLIDAASGKAAMRTLLVDSRKVHSCPLNPDPKPN